MRILTYARCFSFAQNIFVSNKWGFTNFTRPQYEILKGQGRLIEKGVHVEVRNGTGVLNTSDAILMY